MASTTTMNNWLEALALTFTRPSTTSTDLRKLKDNFARRVKHHTYGRTNQFAVTEKLIGLEEKFQVLNLDDVASELFSRRVELERDYEDVKWLPDVLDLLLNLSHDPVKYSRVENLEKSKPSTDTSPELKLEDIEAEDPIDRRDPIWRVPQYSDFSSDEDEAVGVSSTQTSPASIISEHKREVDTRWILDVSASTVTSDLKTAQFWQSSDQVVTVTETQAAREVLFMLGGLPTSIFASSSHGVSPNPRYRISHLEASTSLSLLMEAASLASKVDAIRQWLHLRPKSSVLQLIRSEISDVLADFELAISQEHSEVLRQTSPDGVVSLLQVLQRLNRASLPLNAVNTVISHSNTNDTVGVLSVLYENLETAQSLCNTVDLETLLPIFLSALTFYSKHVDLWLHTGRINAKESFFIIDNEKIPRNKDTLWHDWFTLSSQHDELIPAFLKKSAAEIFKIGKTAAFLSHLGSATIVDHTEDLGIAAAAIEAAQLVASSPLPFSAGFELVLERHLTTMLNSSTHILKGILETGCGLTRVLDAFDYLYLSKEGVILSAIENKMFDHIDRCMEMWNDRFLLGNSLAEAYAPVHCVNAEAITIQTAYTSSRTMENRRRSVKILSAVSISYHLSWPLANIVSSVSMGSYRRISLTLSQIRRARYLLERRAYFFVQHIPLFDSQNDTKLARLVYWQLSLFVNILYAHLTNCLIQPFTAAMRQQLYAVSTNSLDEMISIHSTYIVVLEHACLSGKRIKPLRDALISILDLCIRFTDLVSSSTSDTAIWPGSGERDGDFEASSFISAQSRRRRQRKQTDDSSSSDDDDEGAAGEGYSTFILEEDTSLIQEIRKIRGEFKRHVEFLIAGLRAVARSSASSTRGARYAGKFEIGERLELLADGLAGVFPARERRGLIGF